MEILIVIIVIAFVIYILYKKYVDGGVEIQSKDKGYDMNNPPFKMAFSILTKTELKFYSELKRKIDLDKYVICPKVRVWDVLWVKTYANNKRTFINKISKKHFDFVICDIKNFKPLCAVELDDKTHQQEDRIERDNFIDELFRNLKFDVIHVKVQNTYDDEIENIIELVSHISLKDNSVYEE